MENIYLEDITLIKAKYPYKFSINCRPFLDYPISEYDNLDIKIIIELTKVTYKINIFEFKCLRICKIFELQNSFFDYLIL